MLNSKEYSNLLKIGKLLFGTESNFQFWLQRPNYFFGKNKNGEYIKPIDSTESEVFNQLKKLDVKKM